MQNRVLLLNIIAALTVGCAGEKYTMCFDVEDADASCPTASEVDIDELFAEPGECPQSNIRAVLDDGELVDDTRFGLACCYTVRATCTPHPDTAGRPYLEDGAPLTAALADGDAAWCDASAEGLPEAAAEIAACWHRMGLMEHASVAAFARLTLELMAAGAPPDLLADVQRAALDEVEHARLCFSVAAGLSGRPCSPGPLPLSEPITAKGDLVALATAAVREGCLGETVSAALVSEAAQRAVEPHVRSVLARIAEDESRHAALSWRIVAWAMRQGGAPVRRAVLAAFGQPFTMAPALAEDSLAAEAFGVLGPSAHHAACQRAMRQVIAPAMRALLLRPAAAAHHDLSAARGGHGSGRRHLPRGSGGAHPRGGGADAAGHGRAPGLDDPL